MFDCEPLPPVKHACDYAALIAPTTLNSVRAGMVRRPDDYPWSSYTFNALGKENSLLTPHSLYMALGGDVTKRQEAYQSLFAHHVVPDSTLNDIREATNKAWVLGGGRFQEEIERLVQRQAKPKPRGGDRRSERARKVMINRVCPL